MLKRFFPYLQILFTGLYKLEPVNCTIYRGVGKSLAYISSKLIKGEYREGRPVAQDIQSTDQLATVHGRWTAKPGEPTVLRATQWHRS